MDENRENSMLHFLENKITKITIYTLGSESTFDDFTEEEQILITDFAIELCRLSSKIKVIK